MPNQFEIRLVVSKTDNGFIRFGMYDANKNASDPSDGYYLLLSPEEARRHIANLQRLLAAPLPTATRKD